MIGMVVVGAGECGTRAAFALREAGYDGPVTLIGQEPGLPYERPPLSKPGADRTCLKLICDEERLAGARIDYRSATMVRAIDRDARTVVTVDDGIPYDKLLLATGARPRPLTCAGGEAAITFRTHAEAELMYRRLDGVRRVVLVGAGLIGLELAAQFRTAGLDVTVLERGWTPLRRSVPAPLARRIVDRHLAEGVEILLGTEVATIRDGSVLLADGDSREADVVLVAVGVVPDAALAEAAGLAVDNGIVVDDRLRTSDPHVFAAGDCANATSFHADAPLRLESWRNARDQGTHAANAMLGDTAPFRAVPWFWSDQYDLGLQVAGLWREGRDTVRRVDGDTEILWQTADDGRLTCAAGLGPGNAVAKDIRLAEKLIEMGARPDPASLSDPGSNLKRLLRA